MARAARDARAWVREQPRRARDAVLESDPEGRKPGRESLARSIGTEAWHHHDVCKQEASCNAQLYKRVGFSTPSQPIKSANGLSHAVTLRR